MSSSRPSSGPTRHARRPWSRCSRSSSWCASSGPAPNSGSCSARSSSSARSVRSPPVNPEILAALEALLFASDAPLPLERVAEVLEISAEDTHLAVLALGRACDAPGRGIAVVEVAGGVRLVTRSELAPVLLRLQRLRQKSRMSRAAVETLAIIAYRQPISRGEIEQLRGVGAESVLTHLLERRLVRVVGRKAAPGRPLLYGTTRECLEHFGLRDLGELPPFDAPVGGRGAHAGPERDGGEGDGRALAGPEAKRYVRFHKPAGYLTTRNDPRDRPRIFDLLPDLGARLHSVGRLDVDAEGLLLLTNDGPLTYRLTHPRHGVPRVYHVLVEGDAGPSALRSLQQGVMLDDGPARGDGAVRLKRAGD